MPEHIIEAIIISVALVILTSAMFYEIFCLMLRILAKHKLKPRKVMLLFVVLLFAGHTISVWLYGAVYWVLVHHFDYFALGGEHQETFFAYIYFSATTYSSLGLGDVFPYGALRFITGVEALNGLMLIGWSVTFTYFAVHQLWEDRTLPLFPKLLRNKDKES